METYEYFPVSSLVYDSEANRELHQFLLKGSNWNRKIDIPTAAGESYEVGLISVDIAPTIPDSKNPQPGKPLE